MSIAADAIRGTITWTHHSSVSAAPLFLIAAPTAAVSIGRPPAGRHGLLRLVAVLAFTAWGTSQVTPPVATGALNDAAILLFIIDGACLIITEARARPAWHQQKVQPAAARHPRAEPRGSSPRDHGAPRNDGSARP